MVEREIEMIAFVKGKLEDIFTDYIVIDKDGIGIQVYTTTTVIEQLPQKGKDIKMHTYLHVREDVLQLFGFLHASDLKMFKLLITVNGIGPRAALSILSSIKTDTLIFAILSEDIQTISKAQGVGKKIAGKIVVEIKDKVGLIGGEEGDIVKNTTSIKEHSDSISKMEAIEVLVALGYTRTEAMKAVNGLDIENQSSDEVVKLALKTLI